MIEAYKKVTNAYLLEKEGIARTKVKTYSLDKDVSFANNKIFYKGIEFGTYNEQKRVINIDRLKALDKNSLNPLLKHPSYPPSTTINVKDGQNKHSFITDAKGRVIKTEFVIKEIYKTRNSNEQTKGKQCGDEDGYVDTNPKFKDQGGHRLAASAGGIPEVINTYSQSHSLNNGRENRDNERHCIKVLKQDGSFTLKQTFTYEDTKRPTKIISVLNNNSPKEFINLNVKSQTLVNPTLSKINFTNISSTFPSYNLINIFKSKKIWISSLVALICLISIFGMTKYNNTSNKTTKTTKLNSQSKIPNQKRNITPIDSSVNLISVNVNILFDKKSSIITKENSIVLQKIVDNIITSKKNYNLLVEGYSCDLGSNFYNDNLSKIRAENIKTFFLEEGLDSSKIKIEWFGETKFSNNGNLINSRKVNRCVIIRNNI
ncbi:MAG: OmpA family protein [Flavobacteriaceae bacterium]|nr:OmpA family protein [Flavobacteriaceae bacterium]